jgi:hypothetical protein
VRPAAFITSLTLTSENPRSRNRRIDSSRIRPCFRVVSVAEYPVTICIARRCCRAELLARGATLLKHAANLHVWIFPTSFANTVFVQYETADGAVWAKEGAEHLAMIEMDGYRIARIRDLSTDATP